MKIISTKTHGILDYLLAAWLIVSPWFLGFHTITGAMLCAVVAGSITLLLALFTDYEPGLVPAIPMPVHLFFDILIGIFLAVSPWFLNISGAGVWPFFLTGIAEIIIVLLSSTAPRKASYSPTPRS